MPVSAAAGTIVGSALATIQSQGTAVQDIAELKTITPFQRFNFQERYVEDELINYFFDLQSATAESLPNIVEPNDSPLIGRWFRASTSGGVPGSHAVLHQDGGTDELAVATLAEAAAPSNDVSRTLRPDGTGGVVFSDVAHADLTDIGTDDHHGQNHKARHVSGDADAFGSGDLLEAHVKRILTSTGPTILTVDSIAEAEALVRVGSGLVGKPLILVSLPVTDGALVRWDTATGKLVKNSLAILTDAGVLTGLTKVGIGTSNPQVGLHGVIDNGRLLWTDTESNATKKIGRWGVPHFTNAEKPFFGIIHIADVFTNIIVIGGGTGFGNAATEIRFITAPDNITPTGIRRMTIDGNGNVGIGTAIPLERLYVVNATASIGGALAEGSIGRWAIATISGIARFGTVVPAATGLQVNGVVNLVTDPTKRTYAVGPAGVTASSVVPSSLWTAVATDHGAIPAPRMTTVQRLAIVSPATSLLVDDTDLNTLMRFNGTVWRDIVGTRGLTTLSSAISTDTGTLGFADVYRMLTAGTTLTIQTADITEGRVFIIRAIVASVGSPVTIATEGAETIDGASSIKLTTPFDSVTLQATGSNLENIG